MNVTIENSAALSNVDLEQRSFMGREIPHDIITHSILPQLNFYEIQTFGRVSKKLKILTSTTQIPALLKLKFYQNKTVNPEDWGAYRDTMLGKEQKLKQKLEQKKGFNLKTTDRLKVIQNWKVLDIKNRDGLRAFETLPDNIVDIAREPCPIDANKKFGDSHVFVWLQEGVNMEMCEFLFKQKSPKNRVCFQLHPKELIKNSQWIVMPRQQIPHSDEEKDFREQRKKIEKLEKREFITPFIPSSLEGIVCIVTAFVKFNIKLFNKQYIRCIDESTDFIIDHVTAAKYPGLEKTPGQWGRVRVMIGFPETGALNEANALTVCSDRRREKCKIGIAVAWKFSIIIFKPQSSLGEATLLKKPIIES